MTISNDGATIMKLLDVVHPAAKTLVDVSLSQDAEVRRRVLFLGMRVCVCMCPECKAFGSGSRPKKGRVCWGRPVQLLCPQQPCLCLAWHTSNHPPKLATTRPHASARVYPPPSPRFPVCPCLPPCRLSAFCTPHPTPHTWPLTPTQVGDGTTTVVILSGELLRAAKPFVEEGVHPRVRLRAMIGIVVGNY